MGIACSCNRPCPFDCLCACHGAPSSNVTMLLVEKHYLLGLIKALRALADITGRGCAPLELERARAHAYDLLDGEVVQ